MMKSTEVVSALSDKLTLTLSDVQKIKDAYDLIDTAALVTEARKRYVVQPWQPGMKATTGVLFEDVLPELKKGALGYAIYIDGKLVVFQINDARTGQLITDEKTRDAAAAWHVEQMVTQDVDSQIPELVLEKL